MKIIIKSILFFSLFIPISDGGTIDPNTPDEKYIEFGTKFDCVYEICGQYENSNLFCASAVAIDPHWVLTAAHVVSGAKICVVHKDDKKYLVHAILPHEDFEENKLGKNDIALCYLDEKLDLSFYPELYDNNDEVGKICTISGYGRTGTFNTGGKISDSKRRAGSNKIDYIDRDLLICTPSLLNKTTLEFIISYGDSGGGLFIGNKLAGINSCVLADDKKPDSTYGDEGGHTRISQFIPWIKQTMKFKKPTIKSVLGVDKSTDAE
jgi:hypothetical protein